MMRVGTIGYATEQGIGYLPKWFYDAGLITDVMVFRHGSRQTHLEWYPEGTVELVGRPFNGPVVEAFIKSVEVMLFFETPFDWTVIDLCKRLGTKTVIVPMYECTPERVPWQPDAWFCPSLLDQRDYFKGSPFVPIPVPQDTTWHQRKTATRWLHNAGNLGLRGHKGTLEILKAVKHVSSRDFRLTVRAQDVNALRGVIAQVPDVERDPRVVVQYGDTPREMLFGPEHDVFVMAEKYNGLSLPLMEARASGMLVVTSDRFPTNTWLPTHLPCQECDGHGWLGYQWAKSAMVKCGGSKRPFSDPNRIGSYYADEQGQEIGIKTIGGKCTACSGSKTSGAPCLIPVKSYSRQRVGGSFNSYDEAYITPERIAETIDNLVGSDIAEYSLQGREWAEANSWERLKPLWEEELRKVVGS